MKTDLILKFKQNLFSKVIWSSTFNNSITDELSIVYQNHVNKITIKQQQQQ